MLKLKQRKYDESHGEVPIIVDASEPHMALTFILDRSSSMEGDAIRSLNEGLNRFKQQVCENKQTRNILDVSIISFNSSYQEVQEFIPVEYMNHVNLSASGGTIMAPAIRKALESVNERTRLYKQTGTQPYKPWCILVSDGAPGDDITEVAEEIKAMEAADKVSFRSLGVEGFNPEVLHKLSGKKVLKLDGLDFTDFFDWLSKSMASVSQSSPGEKPQVVPLEGNVTVDIARIPDFD